MQDVDVSHDTHPQVVSATEPDLKSEQRGKDLHSETSPSTSDTLPRVLSPVDLGGKREEIRSACRSRDVAALARLSATPGGFLADDLRYEAWPLLLGCKLSDEADPDAIPVSNPALLDKEARETLGRHKDEDQVMLDVNRSFVYYPTNQPLAKIEDMKTQLANIIIGTLRRFPMLCYFQGYHDIVQVLLLVLGPELAGGAVAYLSLLRIRDFMLPSLSPSLDHLQLLPAILYCIDPNLCRHLSRTRPYFALASTLTLYAHDIQDFGQIARLFDFLLAHEASVSLYFFAVIILSRKEELFEIEPDDPDMLHFTLSKLPKDLDLEALISRTLLVFHNHRPASLPFGSWRRISSYSVLKTTRAKGEPLAGTPALQALQDGEAFFTHQAAELRRTEMQRRVKQSLWKYRRPVGGVGLAILIGVFSIWLQRQTQPGYIGLLARISSTFGTVVRI